MLYKNRDDKEADEFIQRLLESLDLLPRSILLDLACGSGRHSISISKEGYQVYGIDLSENSIELAKSRNVPRSHFEVWDMRKVYKKGLFDVVLSLFTSLGYFDNEEDDRETFRSIYEK